jgi:hypothetical protein
MRSDIAKYLFKDKFLLVTAGIILLIGVLCIILFFWKGKLVRTNQYLSEQLSEIINLEKEVTRIKDRVEFQEKKIGLSKKGGIVSNLEEMLRSIQTKANVIKPLDTKKTKEFIEETAELKIENTDLNTIVNLLFIMENSTSPYKIKNIIIKTAFENPDSLELSLSVERISK